MLTNPPGLPGNVSKREAKRQRQAAAAAAKPRPGPPPGQGSPAQPVKGAGKGQSAKGTVAGPYVPMPAALRGHSHVNPAGARICFGFNLGTCQTPNCTRGVHCCVKCFRNHPLPPPGTVCPP